MLCLKGQSRHEANDLKGRATLETAEKILVCYNHIETSAASWVNQASFNIKTLVTEQHLVFLNTALIVLITVDSQ
jgi:hypothetical protein